MNLPRLEDVMSCVVLVSSGQVRSRATKCSGCATHVPFTQSNDGPYSYVRNDQMRPIFLHRINVAVQACVFDISKPKLGDLIGVGFTSLVPT